MEKSMKLQQKTFTDGLKSRLRHLKRKSLTYPEMMTEMRKYMAMNRYANIVDFTSEEEVMDFFKVLISSFVVVAQNVKRGDLARQRR
jgi:hypothetical protein